MNPSKFKHGIHEAKVPLYDIYIYFSTDKEAICNMFGFDSERKVSGLCMWNNDKGNVGLWVPHVNYGLNVPTLAHESFHAAMKVGDFVGLEPTMEANEEIAYLIGWIVGWCFDCLEKQEKYDIRIGKNESKS